MSVSAGALVDLDKTIFYEKRVVPSIYVYFCTERARKVYQPLDATVVCNGL